MKHPAAIAFAVCGLMVVLEAICAGKNPMMQLRALRQPQWSPPQWLWVLIGLFWYVICFISLVRALGVQPTPWRLVGLLMVLMLANAGANIPQFRMRRLDIAFFYLLSYWVLLGVFLIEAWRFDEVTFALFTIYGAYQPYAAAWAWKIWRLNPEV